MNQIVKDRLKLFIAHLDVTNQAFEGACGLSNGYIANMRKGVGDRALEQISKTYPELNTTWLLTGEGAMLKELQIKNDENQKKIVGADISALLATAIQQQGELLAQQNKALALHGEELRKQGERLDRMIDMVEQYQKGAFSPASQIGLQKSPPPCYLAEKQRLMIKIGAKVYALMLSNGKYKC